MLEVFYFFNFLGRYIGDIERVVVEVRTHQIIPREACSKVLRCCLKWIMMLSS